jgi:hypothetical protein
MRRAPRGGQRSYGTTKTRDRDASGVGVVEGPSSRGHHPVSFLADRRPSVRSSLLSSAVGLTPPRLADSTRRSTCREAPFALPSTAHFEFVDSPLQWRAPHTWHWVQVFLPHLRSAPRNRLRSIAAEALCRAQRIDPRRVAPRVFVGCHVRVTPISCGGQTCVPNGSCHRADLLRGRRLCLYGDLITLAGNQ